MELYKFCYCHRAKKKGEKGLTATELYEICVGEGGLAPDYFFRASLYELIHFAAGVRRRYREGWLQARFIGYCACAPHCKNVEYEELIKFAWEVGEQGDEMSEAEKEAAIERMRNNIPQIEEMLRNGG